MISAGSNRIISITGSVNFFILLLRNLSICGIILVQYLLNDNIKTAEDVEKYLGESTLVLIPYVKNKGSKNEKEADAGAACRKS